MINAEATGSRKKYLVPLVVLMLCAVALTGAGYAYNATLKGSADAGVQYYEINSGDRFALTGNVVFDTTNDYTQAGAVTYTVNKDASKITFGIKMGNNHDASTTGFIIKSIDITSSELTTFTNNIYATVDGEGYLVTMEILTATFASPGEDGKYTFTVTVTTENGTYAPYGTPTTSASGSS